MAPPSPNLRELARRIIEQEGGGASDAAAAAAALETACLRLKGQLVDLLGAGGVAALLRRAVHLAQREQLAMAGVSVSGEFAECLTSVTESLAASTDEEATATAASVVMHMLELLVMLLGEELGMNPIRKLWPQATCAREIDT